MAGNPAKANSHKKQSDAGLEGCVSAEINFFLNRWKYNLLTQVALSNTTVQNRPLINVNILV